MKKTITFETAMLMMDMALFTMIQVYKFFGLCYDTEDIVSDSEFFQNFVRNCFKSFCEMKEIKEVKVEE